MRLLVLAGGFGTRLHSAVPGVPKALAPVGTVPFLYLQLEHWIAQGLRAFVFLLHHQADLIISFLNAEQNRLLRGCEVKWVVEPAPLNTGGAVAHAIRKLSLSGSFLLTNADTWLGSGIQAVRTSSSPSLAVVNMRDASRYGLVELDDKRRSISSFREKTNKSEPGWISAGLSHLTAEYFSMWDGLPFSLERDCFPRLVTARALGAVVLDTDFIDIGIPADYLRFCRWIESGRKGNLCI